MEKEPRIILNSMQTPDGTVITSYNRHDYIVHEDKNGKQYMVDGGTDYLRRSIHTDQKDLSIYSDASFEIIRENLHWGTYGKKGGSKLTWKKLKELSTEHLIALIDQDLGDELYKGFFNKELHYRIDNDIKIED